MQSQSKISTADDQLEIDNLTKRFFDVFTNTNGRNPHVAALKNIFITEGIIINNTLGEPQIYDLDSFIDPRIEMLTNGTLTNFSESEISHTMEVYRNIAHRFCKYEKSGKLNGEYFESKGMKIIQFIKSEDNWLISSIAWSDEI